MNLLKPIYKSFFIVAFCFALITSCNNNEKISESGSSEENSAEGDSVNGNAVSFTHAQFKNAGIELGKIEQKEISGTIQVNGVLDVPPQQLVSISAPLGGFIKKTSLLQGSKVKKGELVATIENIDFLQIQQDYLEASSQLEFAKADYERQQELAKENVNSQKSLQQSKNAYQTWLAKFIALKEKLRVMNLSTTAIENGNLSSVINLYSSIDGYVTQVNVNIGKYVNPTDVLFEIVDTKHLHAELIVFEKDVPKLRIGQKVRFTLANENKERLATIYLIGREISSDRTVRIHCHIDQEDRELLPGMYLMAVVETGGSKVSALPDEAVMEFQGEKFIFVERNENEKLSSVGKENDEDVYLFEMVRIQTGNSELGYSEIKLPEGFDSETKVVINGAYTLLSKLKNAEEEE